MFHGPETVPRGTTCRFQQARNLAHNAHTHEQRAIPAGFISQFYNREMYFIARKGIPHLTRCGILSKAGLLFQIARATRGISFVPTGRWRKTRRRGAAFVVHVGRCGWRRWGRGGPHSDECSYGGSPRPDNSRGDSKHDFAKAPPRSRVRQNAAHPHPTRKTVATTRGVFQALETRTRVFSKPWKKSA